MKLVLCAGDRLMEGFKHHDVKATEGIDYICDLMDINKYVSEGSCEEIHFTHALEHFPTRETEEVLDLISSLLKPGGKLYIEVPNFAWHARLIAEGKDREAVYYAFGGQLDQWDYHKTGFTPTILREELESAGFEIRGDIADSSSLCVWAIRL